LFGESIAKAYMELPQASLTAHPVFVCWHQSMVCAFN